MSARPIDTDVPLCIACDADLLKDEIRDGFCRRCLEEIEADEHRCPYCKASPCADLSGCAAEARADDRADRARDGEWS